MGETGYTESRKSEKEGWGATDADSADGRGGKNQIRRQQNLGHLPLYVLPTEQYIKFYLLDQPETLEIIILNKVVILHSYLEHTYVLVLCTCLPTNACKIVYHYQAVMNEFKPCYSGVHQLYIYVPCPFYI
jgi:hypothetical protein